MIEEARTEALIRTCSKCKVRILKEDGCNKVICTSCYAVLCDYCGKDITKQLYNHFDGEGRHLPPGLITIPGGKCPLYDESNKRKDLQVEAAEKAAMAEVRAEHPELSEDDLKIKFAQSVQQSSNKQTHLYHRLHRPQAPPPGRPIQQNALENLPPLVDINNPGFGNLPNLGLQNFGMNGEQRPFQPQAAGIAHQPAHQAAFQAFMQAQERRAPDINRLFRQRQAEAMQRVEAIMDQQRQQLNDRLQALTNQQQQQLDAQIQTLAAHREQQG